MQRRHLLQLGLAFGSPPVLLGHSVFAQNTANKARVIVIGGGYGGATAAKYIRMLSGYNIPVTLIEPNASFVSCPMSNLVIGGSKTMADEDSIGQSEDYNRIAILANSLTSEELLNLSPEKVLHRLFWQEEVRHFTPQPGDASPRFVCSACTLASM